jgi:hypothetical protein
MFTAEERDLYGDAKFRARSLGDIYSRAVDGFRLAVTPPTGCDYVDGGDDAGGRNLCKQLARKGHFQLYFEI